MSDQATQIRKAPSVKEVREQEIQRAKDQKKQEEAQRAEKERKHQKECREEADRIINWLEDLFSKGLVSSKTGCVLSNAFNSTPHDLTMQYIKEYLGGPRLGESWTLEVEEDINPTDSRAPSKALVIKPQVEPRDY